MLPLFLQFLISPPKNFLREQTRNQNSVHAYQVSHLESTVSQLHSELQEAKRIYEDKVCMDFCVSITANETVYMPGMFQVYKKSIFIRTCFRKTVWTIR